jgi:hypothetical protein
MFLLLGTAWGKKYTEKIRGFAPNLEQVLVLFFIGLLMFAAASY